jgi:hypothetical protein
MLVSSKEMISSFLIFSENWRPINQAKGVIKRREERVITETKELSD